MNELSKPVKTQYGYHVIQALSAVRAAKTTPFKTVESSIRTQLEQQKKNEKMTQWVNDAKKHFCSGSNIKYQVGYMPSPDPCASVTSSSTSTTG